MRKNLKTILACLVLVAAFAGNALATELRQSTTGVRVLKTYHIASSVTGTTGETTLYSTTIPGGTIGPNGTLEIRTLWSYTNSANDKTPKVKFGGTAFLNTVLTTTSGVQHVAFIRNVNNESSQKAISYATTGVFGTFAGTNPITASINTAIDQDVIITGTLETAGETLTLEAVEILHTPGI